MAMTNRYSALSTSLSKLREELAPLEQTMKKHQEKDAVTSQAVQGLQDQSSRHEQHMLQAQRVLKELDTKLAGISAEVDQIKAATKLTPAASAPQCQQIAAPVVHDVESLKATITSLEKKLSQAVPTEDIKDVQSAVTALGAELEEIKKVVSQKRDLLTRDTDANTPAVALQEQRLREIVEQAVREHSQSIISSLPPVQVRER